MGMNYEVSFGKPVDEERMVKLGDENVFRIAVLGDFSGRANSGEVAIGDELAARKAHRVDVDNLDDVMARFEIKLSLPIANNEGIVNLELSSIDDFHPDQLYERLPVFEKLISLRSKLQDPSSFAKSSAAVKSLLGQHAVDRHANLVKKSGSNSVPNRKINEFESLISDSKAEIEETPVVDLLKRVVGSFVIDAPDPAQDQLVATVDEALSDTMRRLLHHPDFQAMESLWRSVDLLTRRLETGSELQIVLYDITAEELAADLSASEELADSGLMRLLVEQPSLDAQQGPLSVILGNYVFEESPPHADLLGRMSQIAEAAHAPFIASINNDCLKKKSIEEVHPLVSESWTALRALPSADYLMLTVPSFMLRWPYGAKTDPIDPFSFEEFTKRGGVASMLWSNSCFLAGLLLGSTFLNQGKKSMKLGSILSLDDLPFYYYVDEYGDQVPFPCTNRLLSERLAALVSSQNFSAVVGIKGRPEVRLTGFQSVSGGQLLGPWTGRKGPVQASASTAPVVQGSVEDADSASAGDVADCDDVAGGDDLDLDAMMADLGSDDAAGGDDTDLDALMASMSDDGEVDDGAGDDDEMDPDLAALLADM